MTVPADAPILTAAAMREAEAACAAAGVSLAELMERAGAAVADAWQMILGGVLLAVILFAPGGLWSMLQALLRRRAAS